MSRSLLLLVVVLVLWIAGYKCATVPRKSATSKLFPGNSALRDHDADTTSVAAARAEARRRVRRVRRVRSGKGT
eukprot:3701725-Rhodomonas_salina.1